jgi:hypothetical protein
MSAPNWNFSDACHTVTRKAIFKWLRRGGIQSSYRVIINTSNSTSSPAFDSGKITGTAAQLSCPGTWCAFTPDYNTSYYWWLQLWNEKDEPTEFFQFDTNETGVLTGNSAANDISNPIDSNKTFTTYKHDLQTLYFTWTPFDVQVGSSTDFTSDAYYYTTASPNTNPQPCIDDGNCGFSWSTSDPTAIIDSPSTATTSIIFTNNNSQTVSLIVTDPDLYTCSTSSPALLINYQLPIWREVKAE